jgi:hypothetical protein
VDMPTEILADLLGKFNIKNLNKKDYEFPDAKLNYFVDFLDIEAFLKILKKPHVKNLEFAKNAKKELVDVYFNKFWKKNRMESFSIASLIYDFFQKIHFKI